MNPSPNSPRRITPSDQPQFPCWLWRVSTNGTERNYWWYCQSSIGPEDLNSFPDKTACTHWSPSGPKPEQVVGEPTEAELQAELARAKSAPAVDDPLLNSGNPPAAPQSVRSSDREAIHNLTADLHQFQDGQTAYDKIFDTVARHWPSPVAQQDWAKELRQRIGITVGTSRPGERMLVEHLLEAVAPFLRHAPAASGGELTDDAVMACAAEIIWGSAGPYRPDDDLSMDEQIELSKVAAVIRARLVPSPAPHLKETGGVHKSGAWLRLQGFQAIAANNTAPVTHHDPAQLAKDLGEPLGAACIAHPTPVK